MSRLPAPENPVAPADTVDDGDEDQSKTSSLEIQQPELQKRKGVTFVSSISNDEPEVTRRELWAYYLYYNGDNGVGPNGYSLTLFQLWATAAGYDPAQGPGSSCTATSQCVLPWGNGVKAVASVVLVANGVSFAVMTLIFTTIGSAADYGSFGRWLLLVITCICWGAQFASVSLTSPSRWGAAMALYMIGFISYGATLVFYAAVFPRLARNTPHSRALRARYEAGEIDREVYETEESLEKNRISNISTAHSNIGYIATLCLNLSLLIPLANNSKVNNYVIVLTNGYWVLTGIWWFIFQQPRPGPPLPKGEHYLTIGWKQIWAAFKQYKKLPYTFVYIFAFFLLADGLNTTGTLINICQNDKFSFSFLQNTYLGLAQAITSTASTFGFWYIQRYWKISTKKMFVVTNVVTIFIPLWGMIGIWTNSIGYHNVWEFWFYNVVFGIFQAPYYAFSQTMMAELTPPGFDNMFFGLFGLSNRASSMIGPNVIQAIINNTGNNWMGFPFLFALCTIASLIIWFGVDVQKGRRHAVTWANEIRKEQGNIEGDGLIH
ncbi:autophagy-related protein 22-like protein [Lentinula raphanica]|uniref:Autophagy-related protein n=1 Tax=Lentinula raphanica TaxID=153919 RepID=A0AA38UGT5_9AGAR|nr:autophagy-related protein 22-like protein [Lentinula raphanica]KAJ3973807.1 autophagy-related protein 22-like protein [Lentinula raphanica]